MEHIKEFDAVALSGGGAKGILQLGILHYYYEQKLFNPDSIQEYAGTSIGSVNCLLLICGYTPMEIFKEIYSMESFFSVNDCHSMWDVIKYMGLMTIATFASKIKDLVEKKLGCVPTLKKLKNITGKTLHVSGANITKMCEQRYSPRTHPNLNCVDAVKMSCNLPLVFQRISYNESYIVDGGLMNNFPWDYISSARKNILGVVVTGNDFSIHADTFMGYFYRCVVLPINTMTNLRCQMAPPKVHIVRAVWDGVPLLQFKMSSDQKMDMFLTGMAEGERKHTTKLITIDGWSWDYMSDENDHGDWSLDFDWDDGE